MNKKENIILCLKKQSQLNIAKIEYEMMIYGNYGLSRYEDFDNKSIKIKSLEQELNELIYE